MIFIFPTDIHHHMSFVWINIFVIEKKASLKSSKKNYVINAIFLWRVVKECWNRLFFIFFLHSIHLNVFFDIEKNTWLKHLIKECQNRLFYVCLCLSLHVCLSMFLKASELLGERVSGWAFNLRKFLEILQHQFLTEAYFFLLSWQN